LFKANGAGETRTRNQRIMSLKQPSCKTGNDQGLRQTNQSVGPLTGSEISETIDSRGNRIIHDEAGGGTILIPGKASESTDRRLLAIIEAWPALSETERNRIHESIIDHA
jgi:hypothetical protein